MGNAAGMNVERAARRTYLIQCNAVASFDYDFDASPLVRLYDRGKQKQWDARTLIDWSQPLCAENPLELPLSTFPLARTSWFEGLSASARIDVIRDYQGWMVSQFLHGEQFGVLTSARIALEAEDQASKLFASLQAADEARHLEAYTRLTDLIGVREPLSAPFANFLDEVVSARELDLVFLGLQVIGEGIGLASFSQLRRYSQAPRVVQLYTRIMEDEARHVGYGRQYLAPIYKALSQSELECREEFLISACELLDQRFRALEIWERHGLDPKDATAALQKSAAFRIYRRELFRQIVPVVRDIGLWTPAVRACFARVGVSGDLDALWESYADMVGEPV